MVNKDEWRQIEAWVYQALELPDQDRKHMLQSLLQTHGVLGQEVIALVEAHAHIDAFLEPPLCFARQDPQTGASGKSAPRQDQWRDIVVNYARKKEEIDS